MGHHALMINIQRACPAGRVILPEFYRKQAFITIRSAAIRFQSLCTETDQHLNHRTQSCATDASPKRERGVCPLVACARGSKERRVIAHSGLAPRAHHSAGRRGDMIRLSLAPPGTAETPGTSVRPKNENVFRILEA